MNAPRVLILGSEGQLGWELQRALACLGEVHGGDVGQVDMADTGRLDAYLRTQAPQVIVNAAAYTAVDKAEQEPLLAHQVNAEAPAHLAHYARAQGALLVHYSTDYVFDGSKATPYVETDPHQPLSVYGRSKAAGDAAVLQSGCGHLIFRTSWVYAARGSNFAKTILRLAAERESLRVVDDQVGAPTSAELLADVTAQAILAHRQGRLPDGLYHLAAAGETSWHGYAQFVVERARSLGVDLMARTVEPIPSRDYPLPAARPASSRLDCGKLRTALDIHLPHWTYHLDRMLREILAPY